MPEGKRCEKMLTLTLPEHVRVGDTVPARINGEPKRVTWLDKTTLAIGDDRRKILRTAATTSPDGQRLRVFFCEGRHSEVRKVYDVDPTRPLRHLTSEGVATFRKSIESTLEKLVALDVPFEDGPTIGRVMVGDRELRAALGVWSEEWEVIDALALVAASAAISAISPRFDARIHLVGIDHFMVAVSFESDAEGLSMNGGVEPATDDDLAFFARMASVLDVEPGANGGH